MWNIENKSAVVVPFPVAQPERISVFQALQRGVDAIAARGTRRCRKVSWRMDSALSEGDAASAGARRADNEARAMLRIRCGTCPARCKDPLL